jgi:hypothetical protein
MTYHFGNSALDSQNIFWQYKKNLSKYLDGGNMTRIENIEFFFTKWTFIAFLTIMSVSEYLWFHWYLYTGFNHEKTIKRIRANSLCPHTVLQLWIDYKLGNL